MWSWWRVRSGRARSVVILVAAPGVVAATIFAGAGAFFGRGDLRGATRVAAATTPPSPSSPPSRPQPRAPHAARHRSAVGHVAQETVVLVILGQVLEAGFGVAGDDGAAGFGGVGRDDQVVGAEGLAGASDVGERAGVVGGGLPGVLDRPTGRFRPLPA